MPTTQAMKKSRTYQIIDNFFFYSLTALTCSLFCSSPLWFPCMFSSMKEFVLVSLPKVGLFLFSPKVLFVVGNLIVVILVRESKLLAPDTSPAGDVYYDEYVSRSQSVGNSSENKERQREIYSEINVKKRTCEGGENMAMKRWVVEEEAVEMEKRDENSYGEDEFAFPAEELSKRADDFIARVNRQRRLEAFL